VAKLNFNLKLSNFGVNIGLLKNKQLLSVEKRQLFSMGDTIFYSMSNLKQQQYRLELIANGLEQPGLSAFLLDQYLGTSTPVILNGVTSFKFFVTNDPASSDEKRFIVVFAKPSAPPVITTSSIVIYPNPVQDGTIMLHLNNMPAGNYSFRLLNAAGQQVVFKQIYFAGSSGTESIRTNVTKGVYILEITKPDNTKQINKVIIN